MPAAPKVLERVVQRLEQAETLDRPSAALASLLRRVVRPGPVEDVLSGTPLGHPAHPVLVAVPIGAWTAALALDAAGADEAAVRQLIGLGILAAGPTALTGASDWLSTTGAERRVGLVHALVNYGALGLQIGSWVARRSGNRGRGVTLSVAAVGMVTAGGWLGGHLAYALGVGVDTTAFQQLPDEWSDAAAVDAVTATAATPAEIDGVPIVLFRADGAVVAMADRCTHRGGPLHEGTVADGCITCPWHDSVFGADGAVRSGPATRPQPALETRIVGDRVQVRRAHEPRTLRTNPVGS